MRDYYEILSVSRTATAVEIKKAYRSLAMANHPDRNPGDREAEARFKEAAEAYEVLSNDEKRARYDRFGHAGVRGANGGGQQGFTDFGDIFDAFFGGAPAGTRRRTRIVPGADLRYDLTIDGTASSGVVRLPRTSTVPCCGWSTSAPMHPVNRRMQPDVSRVPFRV